MFLINAVKRLKIGKSASRRLRKINDKIPSVIYGFQKPVLYIEFDHDLIFNMQKNPKFYNSNIVIKISDLKYTVILKSIQRHCFKEKLLHIDFLYV